MSSQWHLVYAQCCITIILSSPRRFSPLPKEPPIYEAVTLLYLLLPAPVCMCVCAKSLLSCLTPCDPMNYSRQTPLSMGFSRQEYWSGLPCSPPGNLPWTREGKPPSPWQPSIYFLPPRICLLWILSLNRTILCVAFGCLLSLTVFIHVIACIRTPSFYD